MYLLILLFFNSIIYLIACLKLNEPENLSFIFFVNNTRTEVQIPCEMWTCLLRMHSQSSGWATGDPSPCPWVWARGAPTCSDVRCPHPWSRGHPRLPCLLASLWAGHCMSRHFAHLKVLSSYKVLFGDGLRVPKTKIIAFPNIKTQDSLPWGKSFSTDPFLLLLFLAL